MDKDRFVGVAKQIIGSLKQVFGKAVGDTKLQVNGTIEKRRAAERCRRRLARYLAPS
jgi:uncharacterized protein YjbJ (UPF0337 family)